MRISEKIDFKKYFIFSLILLGTSLFMAQNFKEMSVMAIVFMAACVNQWMLVKAVIKLTESTLISQTPNKSLFTLLFLGKTIVIIGALIFGVQIMGKRIIIPLLIYVLQIAILYLSFRKEKNLN